MQYFINVMAGAIGDPRTHADATLAAVEMGGLRADQVTFEVVESEGCRDRQKLGAVVRAYHDAGFHVSLDDVGAGAASLLSLEELRPDYVKLDADLCRDAANDRAKADLLRTLSEAARQRGVIAVAKGLETERQLRFAIDAGVRVTQGFVHAEPTAGPLDAPVEDQLLRQVRRTGILAVD